MEAIVNLHEYLGSEASKPRYSDSKKTHMFKIALVFTVWFLVGTVAIAQQKNFLDLPYIETSAAIDTLVVPDRIFLSIMITEKDTKGRISVDELELKMEKALQNLGIDTKKNLSMEDVASNFRKYFLKSQDVLKAKSYSLRVGDAITAGRVVVALEDLGISNLRLTRTEYSESEGLLLQLRSKAISRARLQAEYLAKPLGQQVGKAIYISDLQPMYIPATHQENADGMYRVRFQRQEDKNAADIEFAKIRIACRLEAKFLLQ
jgi:uncharacterized protein